MRIRVVDKGLDYTFHMIDERHVQCLDTWDMWGFVVNDRVFFFDQRKGVYEN